jgi:hypothetical protein
MYRFKVFYQFRVFCQHGKKIVCVNVYYIGLRFSITLEYFVRTGKNFVCVNVYCIGLRFLTTLEYFVRTENLLCVLMCIV